MYIIIVIGRGHSVGDLPARFGPPEDLMGRLTLIRRQDGLQDDLQEIKGQEKQDVAVFILSRDLGYT